MPSVRLRERPRSGQKLPPQLSHQKRRFEGAINPKQSSRRARTDPQWGSAAPGRFDRSDVDLSHLHHRFEGALGRRAIGIGERGNQGAWRDLPRQAPLVLAPSAFAFLTAIADDRVPQAVGFGLVVGRNLEREGFVVLELRAAVQSDARDANHGELDRQDIPLFASRIVARRAKDPAYRAVGERLGVELRGVQGGAVVPETNRVFADHFRSPTDDRYLHSRATKRAWFLSKQ